MAFDLGLQYIIGRLKIFSVRLSAIILGLTFIFSGMVKMIDPYGTVYKIQDYLALVSISPSGWLLSLLAFSLYTFEFILGITLLLASRKKLAVAVALLFMIFMTLITLYLALTNPISDCGCFGDALVLTNWETFFKNIVLLGLTVWITFHNQLLRPLLSQRVQWMPTLWGLLLAFFITVDAYQHLPSIDFRPYKVGTSIKEGLTIPPGEKADQYETTFILEKNGQEKEFTLEDYPMEDSTWHFLRQNTRLVEKGYIPAIHDFAMTSLTHRIDLTDSILSYPGYSFFLVSSKIEKASVNNIDLINDLFDYAQHNGYPFYLLTSSSADKIKIWQDETGGDYPVLQMDEITLKTMIRSNPGVMLLKSDTIVGKWSDDDIPLETMLSSRLEDLPQGKISLPNESSTIWFLVLILLLPIVIVFAFDNLFPHQAEKLHRQIDKVTEKVDQISNKAEHQLERITEILEKNEPEEPSDSPQQK